MGGRGEENNGREHWVDELSKGEKGGEGEEEDDSGGREVEEGLAGGEVEEGLEGGEAGHFELVRDEGGVWGEIGSETEEVELSGGEAGRCLKMREENWSGQEGRTVATGVFWVDGPDEKN